METLTLSLKAWASPESKGSVSQGERPGLWRDQDVAGCDTRRTEAGKGGAPSGPPRRAWGPAGTSVLSKVCFLTNKQYLKRRNHKQSPSPH